MMKRIYILLIYCLSLGSAFAQYTKERSSDAASEAKNLLENYLTGINAIGNPQEDEDERMNFYVKEMVKSFRKEDALVFNDLDPKRESGNDLPVDRYASNHILWFTQSGIKNELDLANARYSPLLKTDKGSLYMDVYVSKKVKGLFMNTIPVENTYPLAFKIGLEDKGAYFTDFKFIGVTQSESIPMQAVKLSDIGKGGAGKNDSADLLMALLEEISANFSTNKPAHLKQVRLEKLKYKNTEMCSQFSKVVNNYFYQKLQEIGHFQVKAQVNDIQSTTQGFGTEDHVIEGNYEEAGNALQLNVVLKDSHTNKVVSTVKKTLPLSWFQNHPNVAYQPEGLQSALQTQQEIKAGEIRNDFDAEVMTSKGGSGTTFTEGERMRLSVRVAKPCYIRFIYHLSDGQKVLLMDNYFIEAQNVNKWVEIPQEFECAAPFGIETLQLNASNKQFQTLNTKLESGYTFILDDIKKINLTNRGIKAVEGENLKAEKRIVLTTTSKLK